MAETTVNANLKININPASIQPALASIQKQLASVRVHIPVEPQFNTAALQRLQTQLNTFSRSANILSPVSQSISNIGRSLDTVNTAAIGTGQNFQQATRSVQSFGEAIGLSAKRFTTFAVAAGVISTVVFQFGSAIKAAVDFDTEMVRLKQVGGDSTAVIKGMSSEISRLATTWGVSSDELAKASVLLRSAGLSARDTKVALDTLAKTAVAPLFKNVTESTQAAIAIMQQFGVSASKLEGVFSGINKVANETAVEAQDIIEAIPRMGAAFEIAGASIEDTIAIFSAVRARTRESAESISTGLRTIFARIERPAVLDQLENLGLKVRDFAGNMRKPIEIIGELYRVLSKEPPGSAKLFGVVEAIGGIRQVAKTVPLIQEYPEIEKNIQRLKESQGNLTETAVVGLEAFSRSVGRLKESFVDLFRTIGSNSTLRQVIDVITNATIAFTQLAKAIEPVVPLLLGLATFKIFTGTSNLLGKIGAGWQRPISGRATGGSISETNMGLSGPDNVLIRAQTGEFMMTKEATKDIGSHTLERLNKDPQFRLATKFMEMSGIRKYQGGGLVEQAMEAARQVPQSQWFGGEKVFLHHAYEQWVKKYGGKLSLEEFKTQLANSPEARKYMSRLDMVQLFPAEEVAKSNVELNYGGRGKFEGPAASFNFLRPNDFPVQSTPQQSISQVIVEQVRIEEERKEAEYKKYSERAEKIRAENLRKANLEREAVRKERGSLPSFQPRPITTAIPMGTKVNPPLGVTTFGQETLPVPPPIKPPVTAIDPGREIQLWTPHLAQPPFGQRVDITPPGLPGREIQRWTPHLMGQRVNIAPPISIPFNENEIPGLLGGGPNYEDLFAHPQFAEQHFGITPPIAVGPPDARGRFRRFFGNQFQNLRNSRILRSGLAVAGVASFYAPHLLENQFGTAQQSLQPNAQYGPGTAATAAGAGGLLTGAVTGGIGAGFAAASIPGLAPFALLAAAAGAVIGGFTGLTGAMKNFSDSLERAKLDQFDKDIQNIRIDFKKGVPENAFQTTNINRAINELLKPEEKGFFGGISDSISEYLTRLVTGLTENRFTKEFRNIEALTPAQKERGSAFASDIMKRLIEANPNRTPEEINRRWMAGGGQDLIKLINYIPKAYDAIVKYRDAHNQSTDILRKLIGIQAESINSYGRIDAVITELTNRFEVAGKTFEQAGQIAENIGAPLLSGKITGAVGTAPQVGGRELFEFAKPGGGFEEAKRTITAVLDTIIEESKNIEHGPGITGFPGEEENEKIRLNQKERALFLFGQTPASQGFLGKELAGQLGAYVGTQGLNLASRVGAAGSPRIAENITREAADLVEKQRQAQARANQISNEQNRRQVETAQMQMEHRQRLVGFVGGVGQQRIEEQARLTQINPLTAFGVTRGGQAISPISPQDIAIQRNAQIREQIFNQQQELLTGVKGAGGATAEQLTTAIQTREKQAINLQAQIVQRQAAGAGGEELNKLNNQYIAAQKGILGLRAALENLANSTLKLDTAQEKFQSALSKQSADLQARKGIAQLATFGGMQEKFQFAQREELVNRAARLGPQGFQAFATDEEKQMVLQQLQATQGLTRQYSTGSIGRFRSRETGQIYYAPRRTYTETSEQLQERLQLPFQAAFLNNPVAAGLQRNVNQANQAINIANQQRNQAGGGLLQAQGGAIARQGILNQDSFQQFIQNMNKSVSDQMDSLNKFTQQTDKFMDFWKNFNPTLSIRRDGVVQVILNGGEVLARAKVEIEDDVLKAIVNQLADDKTQLGQALKRAVAQQPAI